MELHKDYHNDLVLFHIFVMTTSIYSKDNLDLYNDVEKGSIYSADALTTLLKMQEYLSACIVLRKSYILSGSSV